VSTSASILQEETSIDEFFNVMATETLALFEHLEFDFLKEFDVFAPLAGGEHRSSPPALFRAFLHCYYKNVYGIRPVTRELQNTVVWLELWLRSTAVEETRSIASSPTSNTSSTGLRPPRRAGRLPRPARLDLSIDSTDVRTMPADQDASKGYDPTAEEYYHGYGCTIVSTGQKIPIAAGSPRASKRQRRRRCASRVTRSPSKPIWMLETAPTTRSAGTTTCWPQGSCQSLRTTHETPTIRKTSSTGSKPASTNTARTFS